MDLEILEPNIIRAKVLNREQMKKLIFFIGLKDDIKKLKQHISDKMVSEVNGYGLIIEKMKTVIL